MSAADKFTPAEVQYQLSHAGETKGPIIMAVIGTFSALATISVVLRIWVRLLKHNSFQADDYTLFIAFIFSWASFVTYYYRTQNGDGMHLLVITPEMVHRYSRAFFASVLFYVLAQMFTQISMLFLYRRVFTLLRTWFRYTLIVISFFSLGSGISMLLANIFACSPIKKAWAWETAAAGDHCISVLNVAIAYSALSLVVDLAIVTVPIPLIWGLNASRRTRVAVSGMILLGGLVSIVNPIKIYYFTRHFDGDVTYYADVAPDIWVHVQICLGIIGATMPCIKPLFHGFQGIFSSGGPSASAPTSGNLRSARSAKGPAADQYNSLEGEDRSLAESDIGLVPLQQWTATPSFPGQSSSIQTKSVIEGGGARSSDIERGISLNEIGVTRDVDVTSSRVG